MRGRCLMLLCLALVFPAKAEAGASGHIRTLAASCAACHGVEGNSVGGTPVLAGLERSHFVLQMQAFRSGGRSSTVMHHHAKGLTETEIDQLAGYFAAIVRQPASQPEPLGER